MVNKPLIWIMHAKYHKILIIHRWNSPTAKHDSQQNLVTNQSAKTAMQLSGEVFWKNSKYGNPMQFFQKLQIYIPIIVFMLPNYKSTVLGQSKHHDTDGQQDIGIMGSIEYKNQCASDWTFCSKLYKQYADRSLWFIS